ncbi:hypothetical protein AAKU61_001424 [Undibacterium sp. GrIS 1.2]
MAGSIIIAQNVILGFNTVAFHYIVEKIRSHFDENRKFVMERIYEPLDEGGMTFIDISVASTDEFREFCGATARCRSECNANPTAYDVWWDRLWEMLSEDSRFYA